MAGARYIILQNLNTAEYVWIDLYEKRYKRMCNRIESWYYTIIDMYDCVPAYHLTLTYDMKVYKWDGRQISQFTNLLMKQNRIYEFAWVMEIQRNHNPHYHMIAITDGGFLFSKNAHFLFS